MASKQNSIVGKSEKQGEKNVSLMLDSEVTKTKRSDYGEPKLVLTKPKN